MRPKPAPGRVKTGIILTIKRMRILQNSWGLFKFGPDMISTSSLARLQFRQFFKGRKSELIGRIIITAYIWLISIIVLVLAGVGKDIPSGIWAAMLLSFTIPDFVFKLIFEPSSSVMDAFIKSRPITRERWKRFLAVSQLWNPANLELPIALAPLCFLCLPLASAFILMVVLYLLSVFGGYLVMLLKRRGPYQSEKQVTVSRYSVDGALTSHNARVALQYRSLLRSKRLKTMILLPTILLLLQFVLRLLDRDRVGISDNLMLFMSILYPACALQQFGFGIEARSFSAIWTRPGRISKILCDKYWQGLAFCGAFTLLVLLICLWAHVPAWQPFSYALFCGGLGGLIYLADAYRSTPLDLFGKSFFNYQGSSGTFKPTVFLGVIFMMVFCGVVSRFIPSPYSYAIFSVLGLLGMAVHRPFFRLVEKKFLENRYKYMEKYAES